MLLKSVGSQNTTAISKITLYLNSALIKRFAVVCPVRKLSEAVTYLVHPVYPIMHCENQPITDCS